MELRNQTFVIECDDSVMFEGDFAWSTEAVGNILKNLHGAYPRRGYDYHGGNGDAIFTSLEISDTEKALTGMIRPISSDFMWGIFRKTALVLFSRFGKDDCSGAERPSRWRNFPKRRPFSDEILQEIGTTSKGAGVASDVFVIEKSLTCHLRFLYSRDRNQP